LLMERDPDFKKAMMKLYRRSNNEDRDDEN